MADDVLVTMNGMPIIKKSDLEDLKERLIAITPEVKQAFAQMDSHVVVRYLLDGLVLEKIINKYVTSHNITASDEYQTELRYLYEDRRTALDAKYFTKRIPVTVSESEMKNFYETHKEEMLKVSDDEQKYVPYEQVRDRIKHRLEEIKRGEVAMKEIEELKKEYDVKINEDLVK
jgi:hypothetical protein